MRTVSFEHDSVRMIDQRLLPKRLEVLVLATIPEVVVAIRDMAVRGAPAIGATAAFGLALAAARSSAEDAAGLRSELQAAATSLRAARPTASNLGWALDRIMSQVNADTGAALEDLRELVVSAAQRIADEDVATNRAMGAHGASLLPDPVTVIHHCNTGALATVDYGTALGVVRAAHEAGKHVRVFVDETRPRLQGARLTAWELDRLGIPYTLIVDGAAGHFLARGEVDACLVGADRIAANGDTANKIGTYGLAVLARENGVPFYVVAPTTTVDVATPSGDEIPIEERPEGEVTEVQGQRVAAGGARAANPAFDVTPHRYISAIVTEQGAVRPPYTEGLQAAVQSATRLQGT